MEDTIVVGVDGSAPASAAIRWGAGRAARSGARLLLVHVLSPEPPWAAHRPTASDGLQGCEVLGRSARIAEATEPTVSVSTSVVSGDPMWTLGGEFSGAKAIVIGSHRTGFLRGTAFGSGWMHLVAASSSPVVVVPPSADSSSSGVVVGLCESDDGRAALEFGTAEARARREELIAIRSTATARSHRERPESEADAATAALLDRARERVSVLAPGVAVRSRLMTGPPAHALVQAAAHSALLVVGRAQVSGVPRAIGRVTHDVLLNLATPTAVVPSA